MSAALALSVVEPGELRRAIDRAADTLAGAVTAADVLDARDQASFAYDAAKSAARLAKAKGAHDEVVARVYRAQADALEIESIAKRRLADEYDAAQDRGEVAGHGGKRGNQHTAKIEADNLADRPATVADAGLTAPQIFEARQLRDAFERDPGVVRRVLDDILDAGDEPTKAKLRKVLAPAITKMRATVTAEKKERRSAKEITLAGKIRALPNKRYGVILADPEWRFEPYSRDSGMDRSPDNHYPTSATDDICARDVASIAADDCVLFLWATAPMLPDALRVMAEWGFTYKTHAVWHKQRNGDGRGTGYWFLGEHELLMVGVKGDIPAPAMGTQYRSVFAAPIGEHSEKPEISLEVIETYYPNVPKIELNRRGAARPGWDAWGLEADAEDDAADQLPLPSEDDLVEYKILGAVDAGVTVKGEGFDELVARGLIFTATGIELSFEGSDRLAYLDRIVKAASDGDAVKCQPETEAEPEAVASPAKEPKPKKAKAEKVDGYAAMRKASSERKKAYRSTIPQSISDYDLILAARGNLSGYDRAVNHGHEHEMLVCADKIEAIADHLFGVDPDYEWGSQLAGGPPKGSGRFSCLYDARKWLMLQFVAPAGEVPMFGQIGRFVIELFGCRVDFHYGGLFGICGGDAHVIDLDKPFFSETGYRSFQVCPQDHLIYAGGIDVKAYIERVCTAQFTEGGKKKVKLHNPPFGISNSKGDDAMQLASQFIIDRRATDPAYLVGGHLHALLKAAESDVAA